ncbi:MAG TPA: LCP family protein [Acidimicrobiia bacterium]|nr:LCP family protein [Acidimicrobiia bacterium]
MYRRISLLLVLTVLAAACTSPEAETTTIRETSTTITTSTTFPPTTTTSVPPTTTTSIAPFTVEGAPKIEMLLNHFYRYATGEVADPPRMSEAILAQIKPAPAKTPRSGVLSFGVFKKQGVATVQMAEDIFLLVNNGEGWRIVGGKWPSLSLPAHWGPSPRLIAVVGTDARPNEEVLATRTDSIHFVGLDGKGHGGIIGIPRDSWVSIAGGGRSKINNALPWGGPEAMMETFEDLSGLPLEGYVMTGFAGFEALIGRVLGGLHLKVPYAMRDQAAKADLSAGAQIVDGEQALAFTRTRKSLPNGDFDRSENQGLLMLDVVRNLQRQQGIMQVPRLLDLAEPFIVTDLGPAQLLTFAAQTIATKKDAISNVVVPGSAGWAGSASVVYLSDSASEVFADLADGRLGN